MNGTQGVVRNRHSLRENNQLSPDKIVSNIQQFNFFSADINFL